MLLPRKTKTTARPGEFDRRAGCWNAHGSTLSIAVFQWVPAKTGGVKIGRTIKRFTTVRERKDATLKRVDDYCKQQNGQSTAKP